MAKNIMQKLQYALRAEGFTVLTPVQQFYLQSSFRMIKVFHVKYKNWELYKSSLGPKVIKFLAELLEIVKARPEGDVKTVDDYIINELISRGYDVKETNNK